MSMKIAAVGMTALAAAFVATAASPAAAAPAGRAPTAVVSDTTDTATRYCDVSITVLTQWSTGYGATFTVRNISTVPVRWQLSVRFPAPIWSLQVWNASATQTGSITSITPYPPGGTLAPGQSTMVGAYYAPGNINTAPPQAVVTCTPV